METGSGKKILIIEDESDVADLLTLNLRKAGFSVELPPVEQKFGKALGQADKLGAKYALILGDNEVSEGLWTLKTLADGSQAKYTEPDLLEHLKKQL